MPIVIFDNDDNNYFNWISLNPEGFVLNSSRIGKHDNNLTLHKSTCDRVGHKRSNDRANSRTDIYLKHCCSKLSPLEHWASANKNLKHPVGYYRCAICFP